MKILILYGRVANLGDRAIATCMIDQLRQAFPGAEIVMESDDQDAMRATFPDIRVVPSLIDIRRITRSGKAYSFGYLFRNAALFASFVATYVNLWSSATFGRGRSRIPLLREISTADLIVCAGGDYFADIYGPRVYLRLFELQMCKKLGKPVVVYAQTIGPFRHATRWVARVLDGLDLVLARDEASMAWLRTHGVRGNVRRVADSAIVLEQRDTDVVRRLVDSLRIDERAVAVLIMDDVYVGLAADAYRRYLDSMVAVVRHVSERGYRPILLSPTPGDLRRCEDVVRLFGLDVPIIDALAFDPREIKALLGRFGVIVSSRMHPVILGTTAGTPAMGVSWLTKMKDYMELVGLGDRCISMQEVGPAAACAMFDALMADRERIASDLRASLASLTDESRKNIGYVKELMRVA